MVSELVALMVTFGALALFAAVGVWGAGRFRAGERDRYLTARGTQGSGALGLSFFASALGTWILFAPPEVGTFGGLLGILGYAVGQSVAIAILAWLGPLVRRRLPEGSTILEWVRGRFGRVPQAYAGLVSVFYMAIFLTAELTAIGLVLALLAGTDPLVPIVAVAGITAAYTAYGGLPASLATDRWQGWLVLGLVATGVAAILAEVGAPGQGLRAGGAWTVTRTGAETFGWLVIAVVAANLFHQGFWQRVWASRDDRRLVRGAWGGAALIFPVVLALGLAGALSSGAGRAEVPSLAFFGLLAGLPWPVLALIVALGVALVASTTDTLQNALASLVAVDVGAGRLPMAGARWVTVALTVPAAAVAVQGYSVLRLFLIADLLAATIAVPVFLGLWRRATAAGMLSGAVAGLAAVVAVGWIGTGSLVDGLRLLTLPPDLFHMILGAFLAAAATSAATAVAVSLRPGRAAGQSRGGRPAGPPTRWSR